MHASWLGHFQNSCVISNSAYEYRMAFHVGIFQIIWSVLSIFELVMKFLSRVNIPNNHLFVTKKALFYFGL